MKKRMLAIAAVAAMFLVTSCGIDLNSDAMINTTDNATVTDNVVTDNTVIDNAQPTDDTITDTADDLVTDADTTDVDTVDTDSAEADEIPDSDVDNNDPTASLSGPVGINEGNSDSIFITLDKAVETATVFYVSFNPEGNDTAVYSTDYTVTATTVTIPAGALSASFTMTNPQNTRADGGRNVTIRLYIGSNGVNLGTSQIVVWLYDDDDVDSGTIAFSSTSMEVTEGSKVCVNITRTGGDANLTASVVVKKVSGDLTDVTMDPSGSYVDGVVYSFASGVTSKEMCIMATADAYAEGNEAIEFKLESPSIHSALDGTKNVFKVTIKDAASQLKEIVGDNGKELRCTFTKDYSKCRAGSTVFSIVKEFTYKIMSYTFYCEGMIVSDALHCETVGYEYSTDKACALPEGGVGYTWNEDGC